MRNSPLISMLAGVCLLCVPCFARSPVVEPEKEESAKIIENSIGMKLVLIPPGEFLMGSPEIEPDRRDDEHQHRVRITKPFYLGVYEVTQAEFERVTGYNPSCFCKRERSRFSREEGAPELPPDSDTSRYPVEQVSWERAVAFCRSLSLSPEEHARRRAYRLPTEAEWEYACRSGTTTSFSPDTYGNFGGPGRHTWTVGRSSRNAFGLYDMHGNVWEWCQDWYEADNYKTSPIDDPVGPPRECWERVVRGGSWQDRAGLCRSAVRFALRPTDWRNYLGFRVALDPPERVGP